MTFPEGLRGVSLSILRFDLLREQHVRYIFCVHIIVQLVWAVTAMNCSHRDLPPDDSDDSDIQ
jgi:hypothetical protein